MGVMATTPRNANDFTTGESSITAIGAAATHFYRQENATN
jgi:hypothetical protein